MDGQINGLTHGAVEGKISGGGSSGGGGGGGGGGGDEAAAAFNCRWERGRYWWWELTVTHMLGFSDT